MRPWNLGGISGAIYHRSREGLTRGHTPGLDPGWGSDRRVIRHVPRRSCDACLMFVDPHRRAAAARLLLDAVMSVEPADGGTDQADAAMLLALQPLGLDLEGDPGIASAVAAAVDLLFFLTLKQAGDAGVSHEELISNIRAHVLPLAYPDVHGQ